jgi:phage terminase large subunit-like protein
LRQNFPDLNQPDSLIPRSKSWWLGKARWHSGDHRWTFPNGATVTFGYLERDDDVYQYQSAAYQFIGFDELTQHTEFRYKLHVQPLRKPSAGPLSRVPLRMRAGTNPGGRGHDWVRKRFIDPSGRRACRAAFVRSLVADNPSLDVESYTRGLMHLDPVTRDQLLRGDWDAVESGRFKREWLRYYTRHGTGYACGHRVIPAEQLRTRFLTVDPAASVAELAGHDPDWTAISAWGVAEGLLLWLGCDLVRCEVPDIIPHVAAAYARHGCGTAYFEGGGMQKAVAQLARRWDRPRLNVVELNPSGKGDKLTRAAEGLNMAEAGRVWLPAADAAFPLEDVRSQLLRFTGEPNTGHDDVWDTFGMAGRVAEGKARLASAAAPSVVQVR